MSDIRARSDEPPPYSSLLTPTTTASYPSTQPDARASSTTSLGGAESEGHGAIGSRKLLLVYIHGFMGSETSFQQFPAHVHNMVSPVLAQTHTVRTKVYPRYRSKKSIQLAAAELSAWLAPHESPETDVILLGHSMGGLLLADVVLLAEPNSGKLKHRILGTISFDTPFLGMHPGIIKCGLNSLFLPPQVGVTKDGNESNANLIPTDPNFNPTFFNDNHLPVRTVWRNAAHFVNKHSNTLFAATKQLISSHIEFGGCLADYDGLKVRYCRLRMLEEEEAMRRKTVVQSEAPPSRVRFANYYTASSGRVRKEKVPLNNENPDAARETQDGDSAADRPQSVTSGAAAVLLSTPIRPEKGRNVEVDCSDDETAISDPSDLDSLDAGESDIESVAFTARDDEKPLPRYSSVPRKPVANTQTAQAAPLPSVAQWVQTTPTTTGDMNTPAPDYYKGDAISREASKSEQELTDAALRAYEAEQAAMIPEPEPPGPAPSMEDYEDEDEYRALLSEHGRASQAYFRDTQEFQKKQYERFVAESRAKMESLQAELRKVTEMIAEENRLHAAGVAENARIVAEINIEAAMSRADHLKLVANFDSQSRSAQPQSSLQAANDAVTKAQRQLNKAQLKQSERQAKLERKLAHHRQKLEQKMGKLSAVGLVAGELLADQLYGRGTAGLSVRDDRASSQRARSTTGGRASPFFDAEDELRAQERSPYRHESVSTSRNSVPALLARSASHPSVDSISRPKTSSQLTLANVQAVSGQPSPSPPPQQQQQQQPRAETMASLEQHLEPRRRKERIFCTLPPADASGRRDPTWVRVYMDGMDEVGAHTGLFFARNALELGAGDAAPSPPSQEWSARYADFVCGVAERIEEWVGDDLTRRLVEMNLLEHEYAGSGEHGLR